MEGQTAGQLSYNSTPNSAERFATFMHKSGTLKHLPKSWNDLWFENVWEAGQLSVRAPIPAYVTVASATWDVCRRRTHVSRETTAVNGAKREATETWHRAPILAPESRLQELCPSV
jgi:hypothetical protein